LSIDADNVKRYIRTLRGEEGLEYDEDSLYDTLQDIIRVVMKRHFPMDDRDPRKEDVISIGLVKCLELMHSEHIRIDGNVISMFYSGIRNSIGNSLKSAARKSKKMNEILDRSENEDIQEEQNFSNMDFWANLKKLIAKISYYGDFLSTKLIDEFDLSTWAEVPMDRAVVLTAIYKVAK